MKFPGGKYAAIVADPPWPFETYSNKGKGRSADQHYATMTLADIAALPVADIAADDATLFMWAINPMLPEALDLIASWGFQYKTVGFTWAKQNRKSPGWFTGMGYWTRANTEMCLLATRGKPKRLHKDVRQLVVAPRREHSRKPGEIYDRIERLVSGPYIELFARQRQVNWQSWGLEADKFG
jgi:N6-adenosine-specific RNA methylase IME4